MISTAREVSMAAMVLAALALLASVASAAPTLYAVTGAGNTASSLYTVDPASGVTTFIGATGFSHVTGIDFDPTTGILYGVVSDLGNSGTAELITIDPSTGAGTMVGPTGSQIPDITVGKDGILRGWSEDVDDPIVIDKSTGAVTVTSSGLVTYQTGVASASSTSIYVKVGHDLYSVDVNSGAATFLLSLGVDASNILENAPDGTLLTGLRDGTGTQFHSIDIGSRITTALGHAPVALSGVAFWPDGDGDSVLDADDVCPDSDLSATVVIDGCNSGVTNALSASGCTITDLIAECAKGARNHGQFVSCVSHVTNELADAGTISGQQKGAIQSCAGQAHLP